MERKIVLKQDILDALAAVGVERGQTLMVHASLSSLGFVCGGAQVVIEALLESVGREGTVMMPAQSWKNLDPSTGVHWEEPESWWQLIRDNWPAYDKAITPTNTMGAVAEMFRRWPGALRSEHPARSVAAWGRHAEYLCSGHDLSNIFGDDSPIGKLYELDARVLLIGVGYDKNTSLHLADARANYPGKHSCVEHSAVMENGRRVWKEYETLYVDGEDFADIGAAFEQSHDVRKAALGNGTLRLMRQRELVDFAVQWIEQNRRPAPEVKAPGLTLVEPCEKYLASFLEAREEALAGGMTDEGFSGAPAEELLGRYDDLRHGRNLPPGWVAADHYWLVDEGRGRFIGEVCIRHSLTAALERYGGHIGYAVRPSEWNRGCGTLMLALALEKAQGLGLSDVLATCDDDNLASARVMEKNGFVLRDKVRNTVDGREVTTRRYTRPL